MQITDYLGSDWTGSLDVTSDMDEFKAISMETDINMENVNKHLSLSIHSNQSQSLDLYIYSPYWLVNKTELPLQLRVRQALRHSLAWYLNTGCLNTFAYCKLLLSPNYITLWSHSFNLIKIFSLKYDISIHEDLNSPP